MKYSLLYADGCGSTGNAEISRSIREAIYNLNIDRMVSGAGVSATDAEYFLSVLTVPLTDTRRIDYRRAVTEDLMNEPKLLESLISVLKGYDNLRAETEEMAGGIFKYGAGHSSAAMVDYAYERAYVSAHFMRNVIAYINGVNSVFAAFEPKSEGLQAIKEFCARVTADGDIAEAERTAELFQNETVENYRFRIALATDSLLRISGAEITDITQKKKERFNPLSVLKPKKKEEIPSTVDIGTSAAENADIATAYALEELADHYDALGNGLYERLFGISEELRFFRAALGVCRALRSAELPVCYPTVLSAESNTMSATGICDILLLNEGKSSKTIVPNDAVMDSGAEGILVRGDNNCGKTSFLRSVGTAQLFAQSGLFVCAESFTASVRYGIFSHFSSAEKEFEDNDAAGRFEGEVKDIAALLRKLRPYSLVLLNETFQTTAYREGAEGMKLILDALPVNGSKYIFVTHMLTVFKLFREGADNAVMLKTGEGEQKYKLLPFSE